MGSPASSMRLLAPLPRTLPQRRPMSHSISSVRKSAILKPDHVRLPRACSASCRFAHVGISLASIVLVRVVLLVERHRPNGQFNRHPQPDGGDLPVSKPPEVSYVKQARKLRKLTCRSLGPRHPIPERWKRDVCDTVRALTGAYVHRDAHAVHPVLRFLPSRASRVQVNADTYVLCHQRLEWHEHESPEHRIRLATDSRLPSPHRQAARGHVNVLPAELAEVRGADAAVEGQQGHRSEQRRWTVQKPRDLMRLEDRVVVWGFAEANLLCRDGVGVGTRRAEAGPESRCSDPSALCGVVEGGSNVSNDRGEPVRPEPPLRAEMVHDLSKCSGFISPARP